MEESKVYPNQRFEDACELFGIDRYKIHKCAYGAAKSSGRQVRQVIIPFPESFFIGGVKVCFGPVKTETAELAP